jgi:hypothetical protein
MTTTTNNKIKVTLSDASPVSIDPEQWPVVASASRHDDGKVKSQANTEWRIIVREHDDGRRLVYGSVRAGQGGQYVGWRDTEAGYLVSVDAQIGGHGSPEDMRRGHAARDAKREEETIRAIRRVAGAIGEDQLGAECIGDLPAREI